MKKKRKQRVAFLTLLTLFVLCVGTCTVFAGAEDVQHTSRCRRPYVQVYQNNYNQHVWLCSGCMAVSYEDHDWETIVTKEATCTTTGSYYKQCKICKLKTKAEPIMPTLKHTLQKTPTIENRKAATCLKAASYDEVYRCTVCKNVITRKTVTTGSPLGHEFKDYKANNDATCTEYGTKTAKCVRYGKDGCTATNTVKNEADPPIGHKYSLTGFTWSDDYSKATAIFTCKNDSTHVEKVNCTIDADTTDATCTEDGKTVYTAKCTFEGNSYSDTKEKKLAATGHAYEKPVFEWASDYSKATAIFTCKNNASHVEKVDCEINTGTAAATCTEDGKSVYTATCTLEGENYSDTKEVKIDAIGHAYGKPVFNWSDDYSKATATLTCANNPEHVVTVDCEINVNTTEATCTENGKAVYTATCKFAGNEGEAKQTYTDTKEKVLSATGHKYKAPTFSWSEDYKKATALFICENDPLHVKSIDCEITAEGVAASCTEDGKIVYTATCKFAGNEGEEEQAYTDTQTQTLPATGHKYGTPTFTWSDDYSSATATFVCGYNPSHVATINCTVTTKTTKPTCTADGKTVYTAACDLEGKTYTDTKEQDLSATGHAWKNGKCTNCGLTKASAKTIERVSESAKEDTATSNFPATGDMNSLLASMFALMASAGGVGGLNIRRRNRNK